MKTMEKNISRRVNNMNYKKLKEDLLNKIGTSRIMSLIVTEDSASEKELLRLAKKYNLNISDY
jgi:serine kinase of HPr protein (carbohydrate metabolism regulator)